MTYRSINPFDGTLLGQFAAWDAGQLEQALAEVATATPGWVDTDIAERCRLLRRLGDVVRERRDSLAALITAEMGKRISEARAEVDKCALACDFYAEHASAFLADEIIESDAGKSLVAYQPLGTILAVMPWNFPLWQVFRFLAPTLAAGNTGLLKHASNVPQCAMAVEELVCDAGFPAGVFRTLMIESARVADVIADPRVHAVTLTGSEPAGREVAAAAGRNLKKSVLELGGSDAFVVLEDADLELAVAGSVTSRFLNAGQSCIAAKRFIVVEDVAEDFAQRLAAAMIALQAGDPADERTTLAPLARPDLRDELHRQVQASVAAGARLVTGGEVQSGPGAYYPATLLDHVIPGMPAFDEELFGPVAAVIRVAGETQALALANNSRYGLGGSVWTRDSARGERFARKLQSGAAFVNGIVKSDPRLPFGGIKASGYGRELSLLGIREFVNAKTIWIR
jgi:succinate-semialdehyde dehydrogenase/glutarate-semialdehyde dehydrogenase